MNSPVSTASDLPQDALANSEGWGLCSPEPSGSAFSQPAASHDAAHPGHGALRRGCGAFSKATVFSSCTQGAGVSPRLLLPKPSRPEPLGYTGFLPHLPPQSCEHRWVRLGDSLSLNPITDFGAWMCLNWARPWRVYREGVGGEQGTETMEAEALEGTTRQMQPGGASSLGYDRDGGAANSHGHAGRRKRRMTR